MKRGFIPLCVPEIRGNEWRYLKECLDTNFVSSVGPFVERFERELAAYVGARFAVATASGTAALHVSLLASEVEMGDEVLVSTLTFIAPANTIRYVGAHPVFVDADPQTLQMDVELVRDFVENGCTWKDGVLRNKRTGRRVAAVMPVHVLGHPVDMDPILQLSRTFGISVIEDATESLGGKYKGLPTGTLGSIGCFSFNGNKVITTGGGGMIVTDDEAIAEKVRYLTTQAKDNPVEYIHHEIGYNYRMTNVLAALGCAQLEKLDSYVASKRAIANRYDKALLNLPGISRVREAPWAFSTEWMYTVQVDEKGFGRNSRDVLRHLSDQGIQSRPLWQPLHLSRAHKGEICLRGGVAEEFNRASLSLPCSVGLTEADQEVVIGMFGSLLGSA